MCIRDSNRNKRSAVVDVRNEAGLAVALDLIGRADVFLTNFRPAALERLGLGSEALLARNPRLVYGLITGYGLEGPDKDKAAYDIAGFWARAGIAHMLTQPGGVPPFQRGGMGDHSVGISTAGAICAALYSREKTNQSRLWHCDTTDSDNPLVANTARKAIKLCLITRFERKLALFC